MKIPVPKAGDWAYSNRVTPGGGGCNGRFADREQTRATDDLFADILYRFDIVHARIVKDVVLFASFFLGHFSSFSLASIILNLSYTYHHCISVTDVSFTLRLCIFAEIGLLLLGAMVLKARRKRGRVGRALGNPRRQIYVWEDTVELFLSERRQKKLCLFACLSYFVLCDVQQKAESFPSKLLIWSFHIFLKVLWKHLPLLQRPRF